jgi:hypothetical protein
LPGAGTAHAADLSSKVVAVPFSFKVEKTTLPAGRYRVEQNAGKHVVFLVNVETGHRVNLIRINVNDPSGKATLTFEKTGQVYRLSEIS